MKSLFYTLFLFAGMFVIYDYVAAPVGQKVIFKSLNKPALTAPTAAPDLAPGTATNAPAATETTVSQTVSTPPPPMPKTPEPVVAATPKTEANGFVIPTYQSMDDLTLNWSKIPPSAFPRPVTLLKAALFKMSVGASTLNAGSKAVALAFQQGKLSLAPTAGSTARAEILLEDTDLKKTLMEGYEVWKVRRTDSLRKLHERKLAAAKEGSPTVTAAPGSVSAEGKPTAAANGSYPLLVAHLRSGEVTELKAENISRWSDAVATMHEGKPAWAIQVNAEVASIFGLQPVNITCIVRDSRVLGWFYDGSGEPVP